MGAVLSQRPVSRILAVAAVVSLLRFLQAKQKKGIGSGSDSSQAAPRPIRPPPRSDSGRSSGSKGSGKGRPSEPKQGCRGSIKAFSLEKGFGFIIFGGGEIFVHMNDVRNNRAPEAGDTVCFDIAPDSRNNGKLKAANVYVETVGKGSMPQGDRAWDGFKGTSKGTAPPRSSEEPTASGSVTDARQAPAGLSASGYRPPALLADDVELWICLDFEWTCDEGEPEVRRVRAEEGEIIEFAYAVYDAKSGATVCEGQHYCKPTRTPITEFCVRLTGISEEKVKDAGSLGDALRALDEKLNAEGLVGRSKCAVAHGSADLELMLPRNCKEQGLEVPPYLRRYVDLREATQSHLAAKGIQNQRGSTLRQICEALRVQMLGDEHCGLDDSWMVLLAFQQLLMAKATLIPVDIDAERAAFAAGTWASPTMLCLDGLAFFALATELLPWIEAHLGQAVCPSALSLILGLDARPTGRALLEFDSHAAALAALQATDNGAKRLVCGRPDVWPFEAPKERLVLVRPLRHHELRLPWVSRDALAAGGVAGPGLTAFPADPQEMELLRGRGGFKGKGKGDSRFMHKKHMEPAQGCQGEVKIFSLDKGYGFVAFGGGEIFAHINDVCNGCVPVEGDRVTFDIINDERNGKPKAVNILVD